MTVAVIYKPHHNKEFPDQSDQEMLQLELLLKEKAEICATEGNSIIIMGDYNGTINPSLDRGKNQTTGQYPTSNKPEYKLLKTLTSTIKYGKLVDIWRLQHPGIRQYSNKQPLKANSRIDLMLSSNNLTNKITSTYIEEQVLDPNGMQHHADIEIMHEKIFFGEYQRPNIIRLKRDQLSEEQSNAFSNNLNNNPAIKTEISRINANPEIQTEQTTINSVFRILKQTASSALKEAKILFVKPTPKKGAQNETIPPRMYLGTEKTKSYVYKA